MSWLLLIFLLAMQGPQSGPPSPPVPQEHGVYLLTENSWKPVAPLKHSGIKLRGQGLWPITSLKHRAVYPGKSSASATASRPLFCIVGMPVTAEAAVLRTKHKSGNRELQIWNLANMDAPQRPNTEDTFTVRVERLDSHSLIRLGVELPPGEYVLTLDGLPASNPIYDFSVPKPKKK